MIFHKKVKGNKYQCLYCLDKFADENDAKECVEKHNLVLVPVGVDDLERMSNYLSTGEEKYLSDPLLLSKSIGQRLVPYFRRIVNKYKTQKQQEL